MDDAIESQDIPHDDVANHNCPRGLQRNWSGPAAKQGLSREGVSKAGLTRGAMELLSEPTSLTKRLSPEWAGSNVPWLALALRKVALEAWSSRSGPLSV